MQPRFIPILLIQNRRLVKTTRFRKPIYVGDPLNAIKIFNEKQVDEITIFDISRSHQPPDFDFLAKLADESFIPLTYGGGIRSVEQAQTLANLGFEKIAIRSPLLESPDLLKQLVECFGSQSVVAVLDVFRSRSDKFQLVTDSSPRGRGISPKDVARKAVDLGVGEVIVQAVHRDGTLKGPDFQLLDYLGHLPVPVVMAGGVASVRDFHALVDRGADAVGAGGFFIFYGPHKAVLISYPKPHELERTSEIL